MLRNSIIYRRFCYAKKRNTVNIHIISKLIPVLIIFILIITYVINAIFPKIDGITHEKAAAVLEAAAYYAIDYNDVKTEISNRIISQNMDKYGNIYSFMLDSLHIKKFSDKLSRTIDQKLNKIDLNKLDIKFGSLIGIKLFSQAGPVIHIKYSKFKNVKTKVIPSVSRNQSFFTLKLYISTQIDMEYSSTSKTLNISIYIPLIEAYRF